MYWGESSVPASVEPRPRDCKAARRTQLRLRRRKAGFCFLNLALRHNALGSQPAFSFQNLAGKIDVRLRRNHLRFRFPNLRTLEDG
jgi:hypothetical protein